MYNGVYIYKIRRAEVKSAPYMILSKPFTKVFAQGLGVRIEKSLQRHGGRLKHGGRLLLWCNNAKVLSGPFC
ncbi:hypothetical protein CFP56_043797 [Quercus suber]|uniref:Uncharacterized protein n=1 Tax=Quercus suber TaxID=58331 RepID=A0AAW0IQ36_QUESU